MTIKTPRYTKRKFLSNSHYTIAIPDHYYVVKTEIKLELICSILFYFILIS